MERGTIIAIGGAEDRSGSGEILNRFIEVCGGTNARILVVPTASRLEETGPQYSHLFKEIGVAEARVAAIESRADAERADFLDALEEADGVFLTGGNQLRLTTNLGGTSFAKTLRRRNGEGLHVAGTSAGAAFVTSHMIAYGDEGPTPHAEKVTLSPGLGLINSIIIDQHFSQRDRLGRLLTALAYNPFVAGVGLDEDTAAFIGPDYTIEAVGSGGLTIVDPSRLEYSSIDETRPAEPVCMIGLQLHVLVSGATFNIKTKMALPKEG